MVLWCPQTLTLPFLLILSCWSLSQFIKEAESLAAGLGPEPKNCTRDSAEDQFIFDTIIKVKTLEEKMQLRIDGGEDLNDALPSVSFPPLIVAATGGHLEVVNLLLHNGADPNIEESTALQISAALGHMDVVEALLNASANIDAKYRGGDWNHWHVGDDGMQVAFCSMDISLEIKARQSGCEIRGHTCDTSLSFLAGLSALSLAADEGHLEIVQLLLEEGADVDSLSVSNATPLLLAVDSGHKNITAQLLERGANPNIRSNIGGSPLLSAVQHDDCNKGIHIDLCELLLRYEANPDATNEDESQSVLWIATYLNDSAVVQLLLDYGADPDRADETDGVPPTVVAVQRKCYSCLEAIAVKANLSSSVRTIEWTPLHYAAVKGDIRAVDILLDAGASKRVTDNENRYPVEVIGEKNKELSAEDTKVLRVKLGLETRSSKFPWWAIMLIVLGGVFLLLLLVLAFVLRKKRRNMDTGDQNKETIAVP